jgi:hypothetical protein
MARFEKSRFNLETKLSVFPEPLNERQLKRYSSKGFIKKTGAQYGTTKQFDEDIKIVLIKDNKGMYCEVARYFTGSQAA